MAVAPAKLGADPDPSVVPLLSLGGPSVIKLPSNGLAEPLVEHDRSLAAVGCYRIGDRAGWRCQHGALAIRQPILRSAGRALSLP
jgi:hypothetical protein